MNDRPLVTDHPLVLDYLRRLEAAAQVLGPARSSELVGEIRAHIAEGLREAGGEAVAVEATVRNMLQRLGSPEEIVAEADDRPAADPAAYPGGYPQAPVAGPARTWLEIAAVLLMTVGSVIPLIGWLTGIVLLWLSRWLHWWEKLLATLVVPGGLGGLLLLGLTTARSCTTTSVDGVVVDSCASPSAWDAALPWVFGAAALLSLVIPVALLLAARNRAARRPGQQRA